MDPTPDSLMEQYAADYMEKVFYFCLRKCGDPLDAEARSLTAFLPSPLTPRLGAGFSHFG